MIIAGVDPGKRGAVVVLDSESSLAFFEKLTYDKNGLLQTRFKQKYNTVQKYIVEKIRGRGGWGATQTFNMGSNFGQLLTVVSDTKKEVEFVRPEDWTAFMHRDFAKKGDAKERSLLAYHSLFPHDPFKKFMDIRGYHDGLVDALLIASYAIIKDAGNLKKWEFKQDL